MEQVKFEGFESGYGLFSISLIFQPTFRALTGDGYDVFSEGCRLVGVDISVRAWGRVPFALPPGPPLKDFLEEPNRMNG